MRSKPAIWIRKGVYVAPETIHNRTKQSPTILARQQIPRSCELRINASSINVANQDSAPIEIPQRLKVHGIMLHQIQLHRTARAFKHQHIALRAPAIERILNHLPELIEIAIIGVC